MRILAGAVVLAALLTAPAEAAVVYWQEELEYPLMTVRDEAGEGSDLEVVATEGGSTVVERGSAPLRAGRGCEQVDARTVDCRVEADVRVWAGRGDDRVVVGATYLRAVLLGGAGDDRLAGGRYVAGGPGDDLLRGSSIRSVLRGGAGADRLTGGRGGDTLRGGPGRDAFDGGRGRDTVGWDDTRSSVSADLLRGRAFSSGVMETLTAIESLSGTRGPDRLAGDGGPNRLQGGGGADVLLGHGGGDELDTTARLLGFDPGRDRAVDRADCGTGDDVVVDGRSEPVGPDCERVAANDGFYDFQTVRVQPLDTDRVPVVCSEERSSCLRRVTLLHGGRVLGRSLRRRVGRGVEHLRVRLTRPLPRRGVVVVRVSGPDESYAYRVVMGRRPSRP
jgi:RTX calcium-binding nonapeptide repeat (4 copies)